jgi:hypothetical protein
MGKNKVTSSEEVALFRIAGILLWHSTILFAAFCLPLAVVFPFAPFRTFASVLRYAVSLQWISFIVFQFPAVVGHVLVAQAAGRVPPAPSAAFGKKLSW